MHFSTKHNWRAKLRRGAQLLEVTLVLPPLIVLALFAMDVSRTLLAEAVVEEAAYSALREASLRGDPHAIAVGSGGRTVTQHRFEQVLDGAPVDQQVRSTAVANLVVNGGCGANQYHITAETVFSTPVLTPGLGPIVSYFSNNHGGGSNQWGRYVDASVRCEVHTG